MRRVCQIGQVPWQPVTQYPDWAGEVGREPDGAGDKETPDTCQRRRGRGHCRRKKLRPGWQWNPCSLRDLVWKPEAPLCLNLPICNRK